MPFRGYIRPDVEVIKRKEGVVWIIVECSGKSAGSAQRTC